MCSPSRNSTYSSRSIIPMSLPHSKNEVSSRNRRHTYIYMYVCMYACMQSHLAPVYCLHLPKQILFPVRPGSISTFHRYTICTIISGTSIQEIKTSGLRWLLNFKLFQPSNAATFVIPVNDAMETNVCGRI